MNEIKRQKGVEDFRNVVVKKPWGREYLLYQNGNVGLWFLQIDPGARTSMHCHPHKKTGLILLDGEAALSFLKDSVPLKPIGKMMIRKGLFHSTQALSSKGASIIEVETPCDKKNLVRLDDEYGREEKPYEGGESLTARTTDCLYLDDPTEKRKTYSLASCCLNIEKIKEVSLLQARPAGEIIIVLDGGLFSNLGEPVLSAGDVVSSDTLHRLAERFRCPEGISILTIIREEKES